MRSIVAVLIVSLASACAANEELVVTGGSRSGATVELSFSYATFARPQVDFEQGLAVASEQCTTWGYRAAIPTGIGQRSCQAAGRLKCAEWTVTLTYQCVRRPVQPGR